TQCHPTIVGPSVHRRASGCAERVDGCSGAALGLDSAPDFGRADRRRIRCTQVNDMVLEEINAILDFAQAAPELGAEKGVHEYRKAVRRTRSLIKFAADGHPEFSGRRASQALRTAFQSTNSLRDGHVLEGI